MSERVARSEDMAIDLKVVLAAFWRARFWLFPLLAVIAGGSFLALSSLPPKYKAEAKVLIEARTIRIDQTLKDADADRALLDQEGIASQVQLINSRDLGRRVAQKEQLDRVPEFLKTPGFLQSLLPFLKRGSGISPEEQVLEAYFERLNVYQIERSRVITVEFTAQDANLAARVANAVVREYLAEQAEAKVDTSSDTSRWLETEINSLRTKVADAEAKVEQWRSSHDLFATNRDGTLVEQQLGGMNQQITQIRTEKATIEARAQQLRKVVEQGGSPDGAADLQTSQSYQRLKERETALRSRLAELSATLLPGHPQIRALQAQIADIQTQVRGEARRILSALDNEVKIADQKLKEMRSSLGDSKAQAAKANESDIQLRALEREAKAQRDLLETFLARYREAISRQNETALPPDARAISEASPPSLPFFPKVLPLTFLITLASFIILTAFIVLRELVSGRALRPVDGALRPAEPRVVAPASVQPDHPDPAPKGGRPSPVPAAAKPVAPKLGASLQPALVAAAKPAKTSQVAEALADSDRDAPTEAVPLPEDIQQDEVIAAAPVVDVLRAQSPDLIAALTHLMAEADGGTIAIATRRGAPSSDAAAWSAVRFAATHGKACLVDLAGGSTAEAAQPGISDLMAGHVSFGDIIQRDAASLAHVVAFGGAEMPESAYATARFGIIIDALAASYDTLILHIGAIGGEEAGLAARFARVGQTLILAGSEGEAAARALLDRLAEVTTCGLSIARLDETPPAPARATDAA